jgi:hypothetical protein
MREGSPGSNFGLGGRMRVKTTRISALRKMPCVIFPDHVSDLMGHAVNLSRPSFLRRTAGDASLWGTHKEDGVLLERISEALAKEVKPIGI